MKIKFTEDIKLMIVDDSWGEEYMMIIKKGDVKEVDWIEHNRHGYKNICFTKKEIADSVYESAFVIL